MTDSGHKGRTTSPFDSCVGTMIGAIERAALGEIGIIDRGDVARLRRMDTEVPAPAFWKLMAGHDIEADKERAWALVAKGMAIMAPLAHSDVPPGRAFFEAGWSANSDIRISRLLKSENEAFEDYALGAIRYLASQDKSLNWFSFARFLVYRDDEARNGFARDFYSSSRSS